MEHEESDQSCNQCDQRSWCATGEWGSGGYSRRRWGGGGSGGGAARGDGDLELHALAAVPGRTTGEVAGAGLGQLEDVVAGAHGVDGGAGVAALVRPLVGELHHAVQPPGVLEHWFPEMAIVRIRRKTREKGGKLMEGTTIKHFTWLGSKTKNIGSTGLRRKGTNVGGPFWVMIHPHKHSLFPWNCE